MSVCKRSVVNGLKHGSWLTTLALSVFGSVSAWPQSPATPLPHPYDVCSVKPSLKGSQSSGHSGPDGRFTAISVPALSLVMSAFGVRSPEGVSGLPAWAISDRYDVSCKDTEAADANEIRRQRVPSGLQALLADSFRFQYHRVEKSLPVTALTLGKRGLKLTPSKSTTPNGSYGPTFIKAEAWTIGELAIAIAGLTGENVVDRTGAAERFDFDLRWNLEDQDAGVQPGASVKRSTLPDVPFLANILNERVGLTVTRQMEPAKIIVVDRIEKPAQN